MGAVFSSCAQRKLADVPYDSDDDDVDYRGVSL